MTDRSDNTSRYARQARHLLANAAKTSGEEVSTATGSKKVGLEKTGEMVWGAFILAIKAAGAKRGKHLKSTAAIKWGKDHGLIAGRDDVAAVNAARALHGRFYEVDMEYDEFLVAKDAVEVLVDKILIEVGL